MTPHEPPANPPATPPAREALNPDDYVLFLELTPQAMAKSFPQGGPEVGAIYGLMCVVVGDDPDDMTAAAGFQMVKIAEIRRPDVPRILVPR
jgi:hypothetical protein